MNATTLDPSAVRAGDPRPPRLLGLRNLVRKDVAEWLHGKRPWIVLAVTTTVFVLAAANARITEWVAPVLPGRCRRRAGQGPVAWCRSTTCSSRSARSSSSWRSIFATMSLLLAERDSGTLAWTISKPVSRTSVLVSKWLTATLVLWVAAVVIPLAVTTGARDRPVRPARSRQRRRPRCHADHRAGVLRRHHARRARRSSRARPPSARSAWRSSLAPQIVGGIVPAIAPFFPTSIFDWAVAVSTGGPASLVTPVAWLVGMAVLFVLARQRLNAMDL